MFGSSVKVHNENGLEKSTETADESFKIENE